MILNHRKSGNTGVPPGFTLAEVMISMGIFGIMSLAILFGTMGLRRLSEEQVRFSTAQTVGLGFMEQAKTIDYYLLESAAAGNSETFTFYIQSGNQLLLDHDTATVVDVPIDANEDGTIRLTMPVEVRMTVEALTSIKAVQIDIHYSWPSVLRQGTTVTSQLTAIRSTINSD